MSDLFGLAGSQLLARIDLPPAMRAKVSNCLQLIDLLSFQIEHFDKLARNRLRDDPGFKAVCTIPGVGGVLGAIFVAEIGDVHRFRRAEQLSSWAGLTPRHRESDTTVHRGRITKQGSRLVRWAAIEAVQRGKPQDNPIAACRERLAERCGRNRAKVAAARELLECVFYALRDGHVRRLHRPVNAATGAA